MKAIGVIVVLGIGFAAIYFTSSKMAEDPGYSMGLVFGLPDGDTIQMQAIVSAYVLRADPLAMKENGKFQSWAEWITDHYLLTNQAGESIKLKRNDSSALVPNSKATNSGFYLTATLKIGEPYVMKFQAVRSEPNVYTHSFTAPAEKTEVIRANMVPVDE